MNSNASGTASTNEGGLPVYGAHVRIDPDGTAHLKRGAWSATIE